MLTDNNRTVKVKKWKIRILLQKLKAIKKNDGSLISLTIKSGDQIEKIIQMLTEDISIKENSTNPDYQLSILSSIRYCQEKIKLYKTIPINGLVLFCGEILNDEKVKKIHIEFEPFKPIKTTYYICDNCFHVENLSFLLKDNREFGFIVISERVALFGLVNGNCRNWLVKFSIDLSTVDLVVKITDIAAQLFTKNNEIVVKGIVLACYRGFENMILNFDKFAKTFSNYLLKTVNIEFGDLAGFDYAIQLSNECLPNVQLLKDKKLLQSFLREFYQDRGLICYGIKKTFQALQLEAVRTLIVWENLNAFWYTIRNKTFEKTIGFYVEPKMARKVDFLVKNTTDFDLEILEIKLFVEYLILNCRDYSANLKIVSDKSEEGSQFVERFQGIGGILRYNVDFYDICENEEDVEWDVRLIISEEDEINIFDENLSFL